MKVLLIWNNASDGDLTFYLLEDDHAELALNSHGYLIGLDDLEEGHAIFKLNDILPNIEYLDISDPIILSGEFKVVTCGYV
jgi:hypothetical protein